MNKPILLLNKPFQTLCQFTDDNDRKTLADYISNSGYYAAGRLDYDSEGLVVLTNDGGLQATIADPRHKLAKTYWVQVEGKIDEQALQALRAGVLIQGKLTLPSEAEAMEEPAELWSRTPPVRFRAQIPTSWLRLTIKEGRNRQVRKMTAAVNFPTLRLIRYAVGPWTIDDLAPGETRWSDASAIKKPNKKPRISKRKSPINSHSTAKRQQR